MSSKTSSKAKKEAASKIITTTEEERINCDTEAIMEIPEKTFMGLVNEAVHYQDLAVEYEAECHVKQQKIDLAKGAIGKNNLKLRECENELEVVKMKLAKYENRKIKDMGDVMNHYGQNKQTGSERVKKLIDLKQAEVEEFKNMIKNL
ncbi:MAG: hypothetical protein Hyperionvirus29_14 [Hyperionvirus sp.]|uniref:Uncharacterized protein n=1 Tax=Hyperionvirus sp. TaxID=2487770 RepID=A0A3G5AE62_9VIRU|nr:MAG: hypothetical protein Hyperionvirus29_14 [Hyperionvirus sp.]